MIFFSIVHALELITANIAFLEYRKVSWIILIRILTITYINSSNISHPTLENSKVIPKVNSKKS